MKKAFLISILGSLILMGGCVEETVVVEDDSLSMRSLFSVEWGREYGKVSLINNVNENTPMIGEKAYFRNSDGSLVVMDGEGVEHIEPPCSVESIENGLGLCPGGIYLIDEDLFLKYPMAMEWGRGASRGENGRLLYIYSEDGLLQMADSGLNLPASDDGELLLWEEGSSKIKIISGNMKKEFYTLDLPGGLINYFQSEEILYFLHYNEIQKVWGIVKFSLLDFKEIVGNIEINHEDGEVPTSIAADNDGHVLVTFKKGEPLLINTKSDERTRVGITGDKVTHLRGTNFFIFHDSASGSVTKIDTTHDTIIVTPLI